MGTGLPIYEDMAPGSIKGLHLVVADIDQARAELAGHGVEIGSVQDVGGGVRYAGFTDPDGNTLTLQEWPGARATTSRPVHRGAV
jgi:predicted enzyme related to lactoylglutathione lyase